MPNPGQDEFHWKSAQAWTGELQVWNAQGQRVATQVVQGERRGTLFTEAWPTGLYVVISGAGPQLGGGKRQGLPQGRP